ncbi:G protein pathway suppressor 2-like isoform X2 [Dysidea avara]|uniref:G protein pathway suppressor 2-like isoform X2 n=1 Tax=Dysidea avara TaxID=196820 RepID=UPI00331E62F3
MVTLVKRKPLSRQQFLALRQRILRKDAPPENTISEDVEVKQSPPRNEEEDKDDDVTATTEPSPEEEEENSQLLREQEEKCKKLREDRNEISRQLASLESKLASLKEEKHHLFQQLKQVLHEDEQKRQLQHDQKMREHQQQIAATSVAMSEAPPTSSQLQQIQPLLSPHQDQHQKQPQRPPPDHQQQKLGNVSAGIKRPINDSEELAGSQDYSSPQPPKRPPLLSNPPMMYRPPSGFSQPQQQPNFNNNVSFSKANTFQGFEQQHLQQPFPPMEMSYQQPGFPLQVPNEPGHMISSQSDQRFAYHGRPPINTEAPDNYRPPFPNQVHPGGQQMEFGNQGYGQEFPPSQQPPHLMGYSGNRGYKVSLMDHTATGSTSNCSSPSSLQSPITSMSMPTSGPFSPHEPSSYQMSMTAPPPYSHDQQLSNKPLKK